MKNILLIIIFVAAVLGLGFWLFQTSKVDPTDLPGQTFENQGQTHIAEGSIDHPTYNSNPPTSGWHWPQPAAWGIYKTTEPDERLVHNLEHGGIWISYKPDLDANTIAQLEDMAKRYRKVIVEPRAANDANISLAAWTHLENIDSFDEGEIMKFIDAYYDNGPEKVD